MSKILDVAVYRTTPAKYQQEYEQRWHRHMEPVRRNAALVGLPADCGSVVGSDNGFQAREWFPACFNDIVGWIVFDLVCMGTPGARLNVDLWFARAERLVRQGRYRIEFSRTMFEVPHPLLLRGYPLDEVLQQLKFWSMVPPLRGRFIDMDPLRMLWPAIDWTRLGTPPSRPE